MCPRSVHSEFTLIRRIQARDEEALGELYRSRYNFLLRFVLTIVRDYGIAEEVVQDVFLQVWNIAPRYDPDRGVPSGWMLNIARCRAIDRLRQRKRLNGECAVDATFRTGEPGPEQLCYHREVAEAVAGLPERNRRMIDLAFGEGYSHAHIAEMCDLPLGTVKTRIRTGLKIVASALNAV